MVENETYQLIEKISTKNSYLSKAKVELKNRDFGLAEKDYIKVLELDENNVEAHFGLLMCQNKCSDLSALSEYYLHLYESNVPNSIKACDIDQKLIEEASEKFYLPDYLEKQDIIDRFKYEGAFYYDSYYNSRYEDNQNIRKEFDKDDLLKWIRSSSDKTATSFIWNIKDEYERRITKASEDDKYNATLVSTAYQRFMLRTYNELRVEHKHLSDQREKDYVAFGKIADQSDSIDELENTITRLTHFTDKPDHTLYIDRCYRRIDVIKDKQKQTEKQQRIEDLIKEGYDHLDARRIEQADESFIKALALDSDNLEAHFGLLICDKGLKNKEELIEFYKNLYFKDVKESIVACERNDVHINELAQKNEVEGYLSKEEVFDLYDYSNYSFESVLKSRLEARSLIEDEFKVDKTLSYIVKRDDPECKEFYKEIISAYDERIDEARTEDDQNYTTLNTDYQRFLYRAYSNLNVMHEEALDRRRRDFNDAVSLYNSTTDINELKHLISRFADFKGYDRADQYIGYCQRKIQDLSESESRRRFDEQVDMLLTMGDDFLTEGLFESANDEYKEVLALDAMNERALLGSLLVDSRARNIDELEERYVNLYKEDRVEQKKIDVDETMVDRKVAEFAGEEISEEYVRDLYTYNDFYYDSLADIRINEKKLLVDDFKLNNILNRLLETGNSDIKTFYNDVISVYDKRIADAVEADEKKKDELISKYATFVKNKDEILQRQKREIFEKHAEEIEAYYQENINIFDRKNLSKKQLEALIRRFEVYPEYKDAAVYIDQCRNRISEIDVADKNALINSLITQGENAINKEDFAASSIIFDRIMKIEESPVAHEGSLLSRYRITSYDELIDYYINKYKDHEPEVLQAFLPDEKHVLKAIDKFYIKDLMDDKYIRSFYDYDLTYESYLNGRLRQEKALNQDLDQDYDITYLLANDDTELKDTIKELRTYFKKRIAEAKKADEAAIKVIKRNYAIFLKNKDKELRDIYSEFNETGNVPELDESTEFQYEEIDEAAAPEKEKTAETVVKETAVNSKPIQEPVKADAKTKPQPVAEKPESKSKPALPSATNKIKKFENRKPAKPPVEKVKKEPKDRFIYIVVIVALAFLGVMGYFAYDRLIVPANTYRQAEALAEAGQYDEAIEMFKSLKNYRDAADKVGETELLKADKLYADGDIAAALNIYKNYEDQADNVTKIKDDLIKKANVGDTVIFGEYEQDGLSSDGREFIEWIVLDKSDDALFLLSKYALEMQKFSLTEDSSYWEISFVRSFLNRRFPDNAFNNENPSRVMDTTVFNYRIANDDDPYDEIVSVDWSVQDMMPYETVDKLFLLSIDEVDQYLKQSDRMTRATAYLIGMGTTITSEGNCDWWLRSPGNEDVSSAYVKASDGQISSSMNPISNCVRPAMWLKISS